MGSKQFDKFTMESSAAKPATCSTREDLQRAVEATRADYERYSRLLREKAKYASVLSKADEARLRWHAARLALARHIVEHGCSKPSGKSGWKYL
jgi:sirohydrochlorin ferrochelatase